MSKKQKKMLIRIIAASVLLILLNLLKLPEAASAAGYFIAYLVIGYDILRKAWKGILNRRPFDECFLMAVATLGAIALAIYEKSGDYNEAVAVMLFYQIGEFFQSYAVGKSRRNITELMDIRPDYANIETDGTLEQIDPDEVEIGSVIVVQPGEKVPIDGIVTEGSSTLNTSALTGESVPRACGVGDEIISGCINLTGVLKIRTTKEFGESTVSKILELVENASSLKSRSEEFISRFARVYTPAVVYSAVALAVLPPLARMLTGLPAGWNDWIYRALTFLVISCPCALVISIPLSFFAGIGGASHEIHHSPMEDAELLEYAALAECASSHPISRSLQRAYGKEIERNRVSEIEETGGEGVRAVVDGHRVAAGNEKLMKRLGITPIDCRSTGTIIHVAIDGAYAGHIVISDLEKPGVKEALAALRNAGVNRLVMLTGDAEKVASRVAEDLGIDEYHAELLPGDKVSLVEKLLAERSSERDKLAFVGDGINDAPVLSRADIGIAMGAMGSDAAIEAADIVLMDDDPMKIAKGVRISRKCIRIVYENIVFALAVKFGCLIMGALGIANMWAAIFADVGVMVIAVLNAIRALRVKNL